MEGEGTDRQTGETSTPAWRQDGGRRGVHAREATRGLLASAVPVAAQVAAAAAGHGHQPRETAGARVRCVDGRQGVAVGEGEGLVLSDGGVDVAGEGLVLSDGEGEGLTSSDGGVDVDGDGERLSI